MSYFKKILHLLLIWVLLILSKVAYGQTQAEDQSPYKNKIYNNYIASTLDQGQIQVTFYPSYGEDMNGGHTTLLPFDISYGVTDQWQLSVDYTPYGWYRADAATLRSGLGDIMPGIKYGWLQKDNYEVALGFDVTFPCGNPNLSSEPSSIDYKPYIVASREWPANSDNQIYGEIDLDVLQKIKNAEVVNAQNDINDNTLTLNVGYIVSQGELSYALEADVENDEWNKNGTTNDMYITPGIIWDPNDDWELEYDTQVGLTPTADKYDLYLRVTYLFDAVAKRKLHLKI